MMAARDTTASLIASLMYEMSKNSEVQKQLRDEIRDQLGDNGRLRFEDVKHLKLLRAVINETLRCVHLPRDTFWTCVCQACWEKEVTSNHDPFSMQDVPAHISQ